MKVISYSLFKGPDPLAELFYVRGLWFNVMMNVIVYSDWKTVVHIDNYIAEKYYDLLKHITLEHGVGVYPVVSNETHCMKMLWRLKPIFDNNNEYVICRDTDALTSWREAKAVQQWIESGLVLNGIHDNLAHSIPLLGGMCGFKCQPLRDKYGSWGSLISLAKRPINKHGTDQYLLNDVVYEDFKESFMCHLGQVRHQTAIDFSHTATSNKLLYQDQTDKRWLSDLCTSFIGAAGCNEFETLRYLLGILPNFGADDQVLSLYPKVFYWV